MKERECEPSVLFVVQLAVLGIHLPNDKQAGTD